MAIGNYGNTPAFVTDWVINAVITDENGKGLPEKPTFYGEWPMDRDLEMPIIQPGEYQQFKATIRHEFTDAEICDVLDCNRFLLIVGHVTFEDFIGHKHERGYALRWEPPDGENGEGCYTWNQRGYNFQRQFSPKEAERIHTRA